MADRRRQVEVVIPSVVDDLNFQEDGCWVWRGSVQGNGYPQKYIDGKVRYVAVYLYERLVGTVPGRLNLWRTCENRLCCNPDHMNPGNASVTPAPGEHSIKYDKVDKVYVASHHNHEFIQGYGDSPDEAVFDFEGELQRSAWLSSPGQRR